MRRLALLATLCAGCNTFLGVDDVGLRPDGGGEPDSGTPGDAAAVDAPPDALATSTIGFADEFSGSADLVPDNDFARKIAVEQTSELLRFGVVTKAPSTAQIRMGLYQDNAGTPGAFITRTSVFDLDGVTDGSITIGAESGITLDPGDYWIAIAASLSTPVGQSPTVLSASCFVARSFSSSMPTMGGFGTSPTCNTLEAINLFIEVTP